MQARTIQHDDLSERLLTAAIQCANRAGEARDGLDASRHADAAHVLVGAYGESVKLGDPTLPHSRHLECVERAVVRVQELLATVATSTAGPVGSESIARAAIDYYRAEMRKAGQLQ